MKAINWILGFFYISTIGLTISLFQWVSAYGETKLTPQTNITGRYRLKAADMPNCLQGSLLELQQSGQFLNAVILSEPEIKNPSAGFPKIRQQALISGTLNPSSLNPSTWNPPTLNPQIELTGRDRQVGNCFVTAVVVNAQVKKGVVSGTLKLNQENRQDLPPARVMGHPTYNNGNPQTLTFRGQGYGLAQSKKPDH